MSEEKQERNNETLDELVPLYYDANIQAKHFKESATQLGEQIKSICLTNNCLKGELLGQYKYTIVKQNRQTFDDEVLLECVKKLPADIAKKVIKVKEYVDPEELEKSVFLGEIKPEDIAAAQINKEVVALRVTKLK